MPKIPQHVVQRGHGRELCFLRHADYLDYLRRLEKASARYSVAVHAYVLMTNHVHLLMTPETPDGVSRLMQSVGGGYVLSFNGKYGRTGTLWDGRYFSSLIGSEAYFWNCHRYIELNPVRAGITDRPGDYRWSSHSRNGYGRPDPVITPHAAYLGLARSEQKVLSTYRQFFAKDLADAELAEIRGCLKHERALGDEEFLDSIESNSSRSPWHRGRGRPWPAAKTGLEA